MSQLRSPVRGGGPQFQRPSEWDPSLAIAAEQAAAPLANGKHRSHDQKISDDFGFDSGSEGELSDGEIDDGRRQTKKKSGGDDTSALQADLDAMHEQLIQSNALRTAAEAKAKKAEERVDQLQTMAKAAKAVLAKQYGDQVRILQQHVDEQKEQLAEDDVALEALRKQNLIYEKGGDASKIELPRALKELKDARELSRAAHELKFQVDQLTLAGRNLQDDLKESKRETEEMKRQLAAALAAGGAHTNGTNGHTNGAAHGNFEAEREAYHAEIKKLRDHVTELHAAKAKDAATAARSTAPPGDTNGHDVAQYIDRIKTLEAAMSDAEARVASATAAAAAANQRASLSSQPAAVAAATPVAAPVPAVAAAATNADDVAKIASLEQMCRDADALLKRREEEMKLIKNKAQEKLNQASEAIKKLKANNTTLKEQVVARSTALDKLKEEAGQGIVQVEEQNAVLKQTIRMLVDSLATRKAALDRLRAVVAATRASVGALKGDVVAVGPRLATELGPVIHSGMKAYKEKNQGAYKELAASYAKEVRARKDLFNLVQELKGNIRVYCRIRPPNDREKADSTTRDAITYPEEGTMMVANEERKASHSFDFEQIFRPGTTQEMVFAEVSGLVTSVMDGFNVCIFAYGQTGSGKTYTMEGPPTDPGLNRRVLARLFEIVEERKATVSYELRVTMLEVYNEAILDLLGDHDGELKAVAGEYGMEVKDLTNVIVATPTDVQRVLKEGQKARTTSRTDMNERSSRSHLITSVYVKGRDLVNNKEHLGKLHLIDLAGSERVGRSGVQGAALLEAQNINKSLSALGDVIQARAEKKSHIPYRNSTLTYLLQDSLEKNSKTLMFVQCSPVLADSSETVCALKFASRVRQVELGKSTKVESKAKKPAAKK